MSAPVPLNPPEIQITGSGLLAAASVVFATCSIAVALAVAGGGGGSDDPATAAGPRFATQADVATLDHHGVVERRR
jgi:hypothetical protein